MCVVLVAVIIEAVVAAQSSQSSKPDGIGEEDLRAGINPHLERGQRLKVTGVTAQISIFTLYFVCQGRVGLLISVRPSPKGIGVGLGLGPLLDLVEVGLRDRQN